MTDFFKGIAIAMVVLTHSHQMFAIPSWLFNILNFLQFGCQIFFVLSAFGLCISYSRSRLSWLSFMKHRVSKMIVGYWSMILFYIIYRVVYALVTGVSVPDSLNIPGIIINMFFLNGFVPIDYINNHIVSGGWFVGTLFIFYMVFPLMFKFYEWNNEKWRRVRLFAFPCASFFMSVLLINIAGMFDKNISVANAFIYRSAINQFPCFALGFCLYDVFKSKRLSTIKNSALLSILFLAGSVFLSQSGLSWAYTVCHVLFAASFVFLFILVCKKKALYSRIVNNTNKFVGLIKKCGQISFFIYMVQSIVIFYLIYNLADVMGQYVRNDLLCYIFLLPVMTVLCFCMAYALYRLDKYVRVRKLK